MAPALFPARVEDEPRFEGDLAIKNSCVSYSFLSNYIVSKTEDKSNGVPIQMLKVSR